MKKNKLELVQPGFANGISKQLEKKQVLEGLSASLDDDEKGRIILDAAYHYGKFLTALGVDWKKDPNSDNTPVRVAKAYVNDLWRGRYEACPDITTFPTDGYEGMVFEGGIPLTSMCSHHHQTIMGTCHVAYIPGETNAVIGLSKMNRVVEHFGRRGAIQEQLTKAIHHAIDTLIIDNEGIAVYIEATHKCVQCRGVKHVGAKMKTTLFSGAFKTDPSTRSEFLEFCKP